jgi:hypothetical protein
MHGLELLVHRYSPLINLDLGGALRSPNKTNTELVVDPDRVLSPAIARQRFQAVTRGRRQVAKIFGGVEIAQLGRTINDTASGFWITVIA